MNLFKDSWISTSTNTCGRTLYTCIPVLTRQPITADVLSDDSFIAFIASELKVPVGPLVSSNKAQNIKQVIRNRLKLYSVGVELKFSTYDKCFLASFPGRFVGGGKTAWYGLFAHAQNTP